MEPALYCLPAFKEAPSASVLAMDVGGLSETWVCLVARAAFESCKSKHETAREVSTFKAARVAAQDYCKSHYREDSC